MHRTEHRARFLSATRAVAWLVLLIGVAASVTIALNWEQLGDRDTKRRFADAVDRTALSITAEAHRYEDLLRGAGAVMAADPERFGAYVTSLSLRRRYPGIERLAYIEAERPGQDPALRRVLRRAERSRRPSLSEHHRGGFVFALPVYPRGWIAVRFGDEAWLRGHADPRLRLSLAERGRSGALSEDPLLELDRPIRLYGQTLLLHAEAVPQFASASAKREPYAVLILGSLLSLALFGLVRTLSRSEARAVDVVNRTTRRVLELEEHLQSLAATPAGIFRVDGDGCIVFANRRFEAITGRSVEDVEGMLWTDLAARTPHRLRLAWREAASMAADFAEQFEIQADGEERWVACRLEPLAHEAASGTGWVGSLEDVTDRRRVEADLARRAMHDPLTGLPNRAFFLERLDQALARSRRLGKRVAVLFLDLDRFKEINDRLGHVAGDRVLAAAGARLADAVRAGETVARFGGDEFTLLCEDVDGADGALAAAERLAEVLDEPFHDGLSLEASIGIAIASGSDTAPEAVLRAADAAMYRAKARGEQVAIA